ncbi:maltokinase N-terminal cap-like domain-containing protein [Geodermatophilus sp. SYSU D00710]
MSTALAGVLRDWMPHQRWFGGKGREWADVTEEGFFLSRGEPVVSVHRVRVTYTDGAVETYLVPLSWRAHPEEDLSWAFIGAVPGKDADGSERENYAYDAMRDRDATMPWLANLAAGATVGPLHFHPAGDADAPAPIPEGVPGDVLSGEQSNTSLVYGQDAIFKLFRRLEPGLNPDVEIGEALRRTENPHIAPLLGYVEIDDPDPSAEPATVAMLQTFVRGASDGWRLATASVRDLYAEGDLHADEVGGDFAADSERLGAATASVHADLARVLPSEPADRAWFAASADAMNARLEAALGVVPQLEEHLAGLRALYAAVADSPEEVVRQRVHGDFHLGQVLRTATGWVVLDFEGEPARPLAERRQLDSPLRDVAGMLRSFDYAARHMLVEQPDDSQRAYRAQEWAVRNRGAFCTGYSAAGEMDPCGDSPLLRAFEADKAVYECVYEARNRPNWLMIPLQSLARLTAGES